MGALLLGAVLASHTLLAYPMISRMGLGKHLSVTTAVGGTILVDLLALLVLAVVAAAAHGHLDGWFWARLLSSLTLYAVGVVWIVPRLARGFFKHVGTQPEQEFLFVLGVMFAVALLAKVAQAERHLAHAASHLADADIPVLPMTRVGLNVASVISQAATDTRSAMVVLGWRARRRPVRRGGAFLSRTRPS